MRWIWLLAWTYLVFVLHSGFARELAIGGYAPHLILAGLVLMIVRTNGSGGIALAAVWGVLSDCLVEERPGADVVGFVLAAFTIRQLSGRWNLRPPWRAGAISVALVWGVVVASTSLRMLADGRTPELATLAVSAAGSAVYTGLLATVFSLAARLIERDPTNDDAAAVPVVSNKWRMLTE